MLSNAYFLAKFRFDTAENEPAKNLQNFAKFANFADPNPLSCALVLVQERVLEQLPLAPKRAHLTHPLKPRKTYPCAHLFSMQVT